MKEKYILLSAYYNCKYLITNKHTDYRIRKKEHIIPTWNILVNQNKAVYGIII
jgi:hypothetical protein